jgi:hypothetical protein
MHRNSFKHRYLGLHQNGRAWKGFDWNALNRLHEKGMISNPVSKAKSVVFTDEGEREAQRLFHQMFGRDENGQRRIYMATLSLKPSARITFSTVANCGFPSGASAL